MMATMFALLHSLAMFIIDFFKSPRRLEVENLFLRHQLSIALRRAPGGRQLPRNRNTLMLGPIEDTLNQSQGLPPADHERLETAQRNSVRPTTLSDSVTKLKTDEVFGTLSMANS
jgi:hypothetical protein